jgi:hypothetical protein
VERPITRKTEQVWNGFYPATAAVADDDTHGTSLLGVNVKEARCDPEDSRRFRLPDFMTFST